MSVDDRGHNWISRDDSTHDAGVKRRWHHRLIIAGAKRATKGRSYKFMEVLTISPRLFLPYLFWNSRLMPRGKLPREQTEAVIIRTAWLCGSKYEWTQHTAIGRGMGLSKEQVEAAGPEPESELFDEQTRALLRAVPELIEQHAIAPATEAELRGFLSPALLLEFVMLVGTYSGLAGALNTFGVPLEPAWRSD